MKGLEELREICERARDPYYSEEQFDEDVESYIELYNDYKRRDPDPFYDTDLQQKVLASFIVIYTEKKWWKLGVDHLLKYTKPMKDKRAHDLTIKNALGFCLHINDDRLTEKVICRFRERADRWIAEYFLKSNNLKNLKMFYKKNESNTIIWDEKTICWYIACACFTQPSYENISDDIILPLDSQLFEIVEFLLKYSCLESLSQFLFRLERYGYENYSAILPKICEVITLALKKKYDPKNEQDKAGVQMHVKEICEKIGYNINEMSLDKSDSNPFSFCPYCGEKLKFTKPIKYCPFCSAELGE